MTFLFVLCPAALVLVAVVNLIPAGNGAGDVQERMDRRGSADRSSNAPVAPKVKFGDEDVEGGGRHAAAA